MSVDVDGQVALAHYDPDRAAALDTDPAASDRSEVRGARTPPTEPAYRTPSSDSAASNVRAPPSALRPRGAPARQGCPRGSEWRWWVVRAPPVGGRVTDLAAEELADPSEQRGDIP